MGRTTTKLNTFSRKDAKLMRLLLWYEHHEGNRGFHIPKHYRSQLRVRSIDVTKMRHTEKNELVDVLEAALRKFRKQEQDKTKSKHKQQPITNYFSAKEAH